MTDATPTTQLPVAMRPQPFARWNPTRGVWETSQPDLSGRLAPWLETWPTCGAMRDGSAYWQPPSALPTSGSASSSSPTTLFRTPLASDSSRGGESLEQVRARQGTIALSHQIIDLALHGPHGSPRQNAESETLWSLIGDIFAAGGWVTDPAHGLTDNQQLAALGNGVLPLQAIGALDALHAGPT
ncbi:hypothetical protein [Sediminivirga luteola]|jgi:hypothetical protein|uniref:DNA (cytosine-5-)-methyltransferase n=1 Tax=Sediminivirga luteola TaxID=1774748 RepID=A0A8J2TYP2_9MICO|nr:hypothetical protein [Sediminivirga luteola]EIC08555.1 hypothetical protein OR221_1235 [Microbacterium laevaniformans OR221]GGA16789.1 hypothetical protein GCM10011333_19820 [Sediminivirga luteola]